MQQSKVSVRGQTVIPHEIREKLGIKPNSRLAWSTRDGVILVVPLPDDPVRASLGFLKGSGYTFDDFMRERQEEREQERQRDEKALQQVAEAKARYKGKLA